MGKIYREENEIYQIDLSLTDWSTDEIHDIFHAAKVSLSDVDFIGETSSNIILIEYKNADIVGAANPNAFNPNGDKSIDKIARKYYDSYLYLEAIEKAKPRTYVYILEYPNGDRVTRGLVRDKIMKKLPFALQQRPEIQKELIHDFYVLSIAEWNAHPIFKKYPLSKVI